MAQYDDPPQPLDGHVRQIAPALTGQPLQRENKQPIVKPIEAPTCEPELLQEASCGQPRTLWSIEKVRQREAEREHSTGAKRRKGLRDRTYVNLFEWRQYAAQKVRERGDSSKMWRGIHIST